MPPSPGYIPGPLVIPQTAELRLLWTLPNGKRSSNVLHAIVADGFTWDDSQATAIMEAIAASAEWADLHPFLCIATELNAIEIKDLRLANAGGFLSDAATIIGTSAADALPEGVAFCVSLRTAQTGRSFRGRVYLGGFSEEATQANGHADTGVSGACAGFVEAVRTAMGAEGFEMAIGHRGHAEYISPITGLTVAAEAAGSVVVNRVTWNDDIFDSQRRRK